MTPLLNRLGDKTAETPTPWPGLARPCDVAPLASPGPAPPDLPALGAAAGRGGGGRRGVRRRPGPVAGRGRGRGAPGSRRTSRPRRGIRGAARPAARGPARGDPPARRRGRCRLGARVARDDAEGPSPGRGGGRRVAGLRVDWVETGRRMPSAPASCSTARASPTGSSPRSRRPGAATAGPARRRSPAGCSCVEADSHRAAWAMLVADARPGTRLPRLPAAGEEAALRRWRRFVDAAVTAYAGGPGPAGPARDLADVAVPQARRHPSADPARRPRTAAEQGCRDLRDRAGVARVLCGRAVAPPASAWADLQRGAVGAALRRARGRHRGMEDGADGLPDRRRRDASAARHRLDAQPGADDHGELPHQGPPRLVAGRRPALPGAPPRRRPRVEQPRLAVGRRDRDRCGALRPGVQPDPPGQEVRPRRGLRPCTGSPSWSICPGWRSTSRGSADDGYARGYPERIVDHGAEREEALRRYHAARGSSGSRHAWRVPRTRLTPEWAGSSS